MTDTIIWGHTDFSVQHVGVRQALDESYDGVGPRPPYDERVYAAAIAAGASDEWRIMWRRLDIPGHTLRVHCICRTEAEATAVMSGLRKNAAAHAAILAEMTSGGRD